jgi:hypothetical protein
MKLQVTVKNEAASGEYMFLLEVNAHLGEINEIVM